MFERGGVRLSVLYTGYQMIFEKERETFGFAYWLPGDVCERETERLSVLYTGYQMIFEKEREIDFRFCILVTR
jgi:hypothetical protein